jgi:hypothetical protein
MRIKIGKGRMEEILLISLMNVRKKRRNYKKRENRC